MVYWSAWRATYQEVYFLNEYSPLKCGGCKIVLYPASLPLPPSSSPLVFLLSCFSEPKLQNYSPSKLIDN